MIIDNHVHVGWFKDGFHSPAEIWNSLQSAGVDEIAVSSTSTCAGLYESVCKEILDLIALGYDKIHPILWLTPEILRSEILLSSMLGNNINWQGIKLHYLSQSEWADDKLGYKAVEFANNLNLPILLHTGDFDVCRASVFKELFREYKTTIFILAHGRPINETIEVLTEHNNVYIDTSFMPICNFELIVKEHFLERAYFGTDAPINRVFYRNMSTTQYVQMCINKISHCLGDKRESFFSKCPYKNKLNS